MKPSDLLKHSAFPTYAAVARVCGVSREAVRRWKSIPAPHCIAIEAASGGSFTRYRLRPDVFGKQVDNNNGRRGGHGKQALEIKRSQVGNAKRR